MNFIQILKPKRMLINYYVGLEIIILKGSLLFLIYCNNLMNIEERYQQIEGAINVLGCVLGCFKVVQLLSNKRNVFIN